MNQPSLGFPQSLADKYRPASIAGFVGLEKQKRILSRLASAPRPCNLLFVGPSGVGKTSMAYAFAAEIKAEIHHVTSQHATVSELEDVVHQCWYVARSGGFHCVIVDEADQMSDKAQLLLLSKLDGTDAPPATIFIFTCNETTRLEARFLSRCMTLEFSSYGLAAESVEFLRRIWDAEAQGAKAPNFAQVLRDERNNLRGCLQRIETELLAV